MYRIPFSLLPLLVLSICTTSCSVKEDRMECPTYVTVKAPTDVDCLVSFYSTSGTLVERVLMSAGEVTDGDNAVAVPRGGLSVSVAQSYPSLNAVGGRTLVLKADSVAPELHALSRDITSTGDYYLLEGILSRQCSWLTVRFAGAASMGSAAFAAEVCAQSGGVDLLTLEPVGDACTRPMDFSSGLSGRLPLLRQRDGEPLLLRILSADRSRLLGEIHLEGAIAATGFSWNVAELPDMEVVLDWVHASVTVTVKGWGEPQKFSFVI